MQPAVDWPRSHLTAAQSDYLIAEAEAVQYSAGMEVIDRDLNVLYDVSDDLVREGSSVSRNSYAELHGTCRFDITRELDWGAALVRPYYVITSGSLTGRFNLGAYHTSTPGRPRTGSPPMFSVDGYDILLRLNQAVGDAYSIAAGTPYLQRVETILTDLGYLAYAIDQDRASAVSITSRTWASDDNLTWLAVVNDLLAAVGYQGIWSDWDGRLRCEPYVSPIDRANEWVYSDDTLTTMLTDEGEVVEDYFRAPNRWVVYRNNLGDGTPVVEGSGMVTLVNDSIGKTSIDARDQLVTTRREGVDVADQAALIVRARQIKDADMNIPVTIPLATAPNPRHWHFDRMLAADAASGPVSDVMCTSWTLPLNGDNMNQEWRVVFR